MIYNFEKREEGGKKIFFFLPRAKEMKKLRSAEKKNMVLHIKVTFSFTVLHSPLNYLMSVARCPIIIYFVTDLFNLHPI